MQIAMTTLSSKLLTHEKTHFAELAVNAVLRLKGSNNLDHIQLIKKSGGEWVGWRRAAAASERVHTKPL